MNLLCYEWLSRQMTTGIAKGKSGRLWFATYNAVFGYDGESFTIIDDNSLGLNEGTGRLNVRCVLEDSNGKPLDREQWDRSHPA